MMRLANVCALLHPVGARLVGDGERQVLRVHSDSRSLQAGDLFVALRGERFDGHDHLDAAFAAGAVGAMAQHGLAPQRPGVLVDDPMVALQALGAAWRQRWSPTGSAPVLPVVAITGSNGKTTVTQMLAAIGQAALGDAALSTQGNFNNHNGVPLTLLRLRPHHRLAVLELGTNHVGEIAQLAQWVQPTVALINNAQREHQEFLHGLEAVARENGSVIHSVPAQGQIVLPAEDAFTPLWRQLAAGRRVWTFSHCADLTKNIIGDATAHVSVAGEWDRAAARWDLSLRTPLGAIRSSLGLPGQHNLLNAAAATACALAAGLPLAAVAQGLANFRAVGGRSRPVPLRWRGADITLVDDSYNANPDSVLAAIDTLAGLPGPRWLVLGDMGEVGAQGAVFHAEVGAHARARGIEALWSAGPACQALGWGRHFADAATLVQALEQTPQTVPQAATVWVKGSRFMRMEQVVQALQTQAEPAAGDGAVGARQGVACS